MTAAQQFNIPRDPGIEILFVGGSDQHRNPPGGRAGTCLTRKLAGSPVQNRVGIWGKVRESESESESGVISEYGVCLS
jgi:hypothetical protein